MKIVASLFLVLFLLISITFNASAAIKIDGNVHDFEWDNAEYIQIISHPESNNVGFSLLKYCLDSNGYDVYVMLYLADGLSENLDNCGFILTLNDVIEIKANNECVTAEYDPVLYNVSSSFRINESDGAYFEIKVSFKKGLPDSVGGTVSCIDGAGNNSYFYPFAFNNPYSVTELTHKPSVTLSEKTTRVKITERDTVKSETTKKPVTEKVKTTAPKRKVDKTLVYFYEKEVFISEVYVSETASAVNVAPVEESTTLSSAAEQTQRSFQIADGVEIQKIVCIIGGVVLMAFAAWAGMSVKKSANKNDSDTDNTDNDKDNK